MKTKLIALKDIKVYENNARINDATVLGVAGSIEDFGYLVPIIIDTKNNLVAGHARLKALINLNYTKTRCVVMDADETKVKEFRVLDNKIHELTEWDLENLAIEMRTLDGLEDMFPDLQHNSEDLVLGDEELDTVSGDDISKASKTIDNKFVEQVEGQDSKLVRVQCSGCKRKYQINVETLA